MAVSQCNECGFCWGWLPGSKYDPMSCPRCERRAKIAGVKHAINLVGDHNAPQALTLARDALHALLALIVDGDDLA